MRILLKLGVEDVAGSDQPDVLGVAQFATRQRADHAPMGDHRHLAAIRQEVGLGAKRGAAPVEADLALRGHAPPELLEVGEIEAGHSAASCPGEVPSSQENTQRSRIRAPP